MSTKGTIIERLNDLQTKTGAIKPHLHSILGILQNAVGRRVYSRYPPPISDLLHLGCGTIKYEGWVNADVYDFNAILRHDHVWPDWFLDATKKWKCEDDYWRGVYCEHVIEHLGYSEVIFMFGEILRTLKPGGWLRVVVPDLRTYVKFYVGEPSPSQFGQFSHAVLAMNNLAQNWGHVSLWDARLLTEVLRDVGFSEVAEAEFARGSCPEIAKDSEWRAWESVYVEARKQVPPGAL
jgi:predicted SAM-dependent methyltransferase